MLRRRSIRMRMLVLVLVPVVALIGLYAVALSLTLSNFLSLNQAAEIHSELTNPITNVQQQLTKERGLALQYLADPTHFRLALLLGQEPKTDAAVNGYLGAARRTDPSAGIGEQRASKKWAADLGTLRALRPSVESLNLSLAQAAASYSSLVAGADVVLTQAVLPILSTPNLIQANDILTLEESLQAVAEERDVFSADLASRSYPAADSRLIFELIVQRRELWNQATPSMDKPYQEFFAADIPASTTAALTRLENRVLAGPRKAMGISAREWLSVNTAYAAGFRKALDSSSTAIQDTGSAQARGDLIQLLLIGGLGLVAIAAAIAVAAILSRALLQQLDDLRLSALDLSSVRLPAVLTRLRSGEEIDVGTETPQLDPGANELGQLGRAFNIAAQAAVAAAVDEAQIRRGVNDVFRNLARRNQSLLTRQLELLDAMERRVHDPGELADLFRVDHLTTRMRRHAEGLLIVAGGSSGRVWRESVPIVDVMRAAVAEIEDYTRIRVTSRSSSSVAGHAVADIIHMLAELVENATTFSPANTPVRIESDNVAKGLIVEIEDRGLGMTDKQIEEINSKLTDPPLLDLSGSEQLGLFIAGQLARRHDVKITMRGSAYGGIAAVVLIPSTLVINPGYDEPLTVVGLRELGGRPVPQLTAASLLGEETTASVESVPSRGPASAVSYILDLDAGAGSVTTTAAQVDTGERAGVAGPGPRGLFADEPIAGELVSDGATPADSGMSSFDADAPSGGLKGAGAWLAAAESATATEPMGEPAPSAATPPPVVSPAPMLALGQQADSANTPMTSTETVSRTTGDPAARAPADHGATPLSPADDWVALLKTTQSDPAAPQTPAPPAPGSSQTPAESTRPAMDFGRLARPPEQLTEAGQVEAADAHPVDHPAGRPDLPAATLGASSGWLKLGGGPSGETAHSPESATPALSLPKRQDRTASVSFGQDLADTDSFGPVTSEPSPVELDGLPVRVRQANLAPQLRDAMSTPEAQQYVAAPEMPAEQPATIEPSPEAARSFMSALQRGWERGRSMAEQMTDEPDDEQSC